MIARILSRRLPQGLRRAFLSIAVLVAFAPPSGASTPEERSVGWSIFIGARDTFVSLCLYKPKPEQVVWGALAGLAKEMGPEYAQHFPKTFSGTLDDGMDQYERTLRALEEASHKPLRELVTKSIHAYCRSLDRYSDYDDYETWSDVQTARQYAGIGIGMTLVDQSGEGKFLHPFPDGPADRAGIADGDLLLEVDGVSVRSASKMRIACACAGREGASVKLKVRHANGKEETLDVVREKISGSPLKVEQSDAGLRIACHEVCASAADEIQAVLRSAPPNREITLDLRGCGTGSVDAAVKIASMFLPPGSTIAKLETVHGREQLTSSNPNPYRASKLILLQDRFTASSAEMIIAALLGNRGKVESRGERSYGKGVTGMQVKVLIEPNRTMGGMLLITDTRIYGPTDEVWEEEGLSPTVTTGGK